MKNFFRTLFSSAHELTDSYQHVPRMTYRSGFDPIPNVSTKITSDSGWGCCYRCCQSMVANYFRVVKKYINIEDYVRNTNFPSTNSFLSFFEDRVDAPLSIQNLVKETIKLGVPPKQWAKPSNLASAFKNIFDENQLNCIISLNCPIAPSEVNSLPQSPILILVSLVCGFKSFDIERFGPFLKTLLTYEESIGLVSGRNDSARYVVNLVSTKKDKNSGSHDPENENIYDYEALYFDPHIVQPAAKSDSDHGTFFNQNLMAMNFKKINPSILLGFACKDPQSADALLKKLSLLPNSPILYAEHNDAENNVLDIDDISF